METSRPSLHVKRAINALFAVLFVALSLSLPLGARATDVGLEAPRLQIPIPELTLTDGIRGDGTITVPFFAQYLAGIFRFLVSIVGLVAAVAIMVGGLQYLTAGGDATKVSKAKKRILDAILGMVLVLGSYAILFTINPALVRFEAFELAVIEPAIADFESLGTTTVATAQDDPDVPDSTESGSPTPSGPAPGSRTKIYTECPLTLTDTAGKKSKIEFRSKMVSVLKASKPRERVVEVADMADACNVNWGSCGNTAGTITALAGIAGVACIDSKDGNCNDDAKGKEMFSISGPQRYHTYGLRCSVWAGKEPSSLGSGARYAELVKIATENKAKCVDQSRLAVKLFRDYLFTERDAGRLPKDWPDGWANKLRPGDRLVIYNGNVDLVGAHAVIFMGWAADGKNMQVVQGGGGGSGEEKSRARGGTWCVKSACGDKLIPLIKGWAPD